ncbi:MAG: fibrillarin-like rRNA/tRNA 2'-O-methyltransferase [Candidatus Rehaiarchaeum fermentans]|nr:fibrillarin-like rRNA/tRNA 2'-O-methyltransferase [Candidatus Rehaiarchaeum fermentans]MCW1297511.1 fibrillarin-like rRNA/tRNA 2'-O-methyltransferase [Candidatus Rehaiarchaeum fermentans]MCW1302196.1 fibrillarin-like rRNA/tRNA 2'-O-methyltransferase [Candidatus Rehaiarchaeum fermentans]
MNNLIRIGKLLYTKNLVPGVSVYGENLRVINGIEYREWNPKASKLAACIIEGFDLKLEANSTVLYLGASSGSSISHLSDILVNGKIYGVEISKEMIVRLINLAEKRKNIYPIFDDARNIDNYKDLVNDSVFLYQDIPQFDQVDIFLKNLSIIKEKKGLLVVKTKSIAVNKKLKEVLELVRKQLKSVKIIKEKVLYPYYPDHVGFLVSG